MFAEVASSPSLAFATSAAADTQGMFLHAPLFGPVRGFCRLTTILPMVASPDPVLCTVTKPWAQMVLARGVFVAVMVQVTLVPESTGWTSWSFVLSSVQSFSWTLQNTTAELLSVMLACGTPFPAHAVYASVIIAKSAVR